MVDGITTRRVFFVDGDLPDDARHLRRGRYKRPSPCLPQDLLERLDKVGEQGRQYLVLSVLNAARDLMVSQFIRFSRSGKFIFCEFASHVIPPGKSKFYAFDRYFQYHPALYALMGPLVFLAIAAPWFVAASAANAEFAHFFFVQEHFQRFTTRMHGRYQPLWYFLPILALGMAPWLLSVGYAAARVARARPIAQFDAQLFLALWALVVFVFFPVSSSKLPSYVLPLVPALALLTARWIVMLRCTCVPGSSITSARNHSILLSHSTSCARSPK